MPVATAAFGDRGWFTSDPFGPGGPGSAMSVLSAVKGMAAGITYTYNLFLRPFDAPAHKVSRFLQRSCHLQVRAACAILVRRHSREEREARCRSRRGLNQIRPALLKTARPVPRPKGPGRGR